MPCLLDSLKQRAHAAPEQPVLDNGQHSLSAAAVWQAVTRLQALLAERSIHSVAIAGDNSFGWIIADLALLGLPLRVVPLPTFFSPSQVAHVLETAQIDLVLAEETVLRQMSNTEFVTIEVLDSDHGIAGGIRRPGQTAASLGYEKITFTSGSTGTAKGVRLDLASLEATASAIACALAPLNICRHLSLLPYATLLENVAGVYAPLLQGVCIHVRPLAQLGLASPEQFNPFMLATALQQVQPEACILVPQLLLALVSLRERGIALSPCFKILAVGGGKVSAVQLQRAHALGLPVYEGYGLSECGSVVTLNLPGAEHIGSAGKPLTHCSIRIAEDGEIIVRGATMSGYLTDATASKPAEISTGDLGYFDEQGFLHVNGRKKNMFITSFGRNVNPEWIEAELMRFLPIRQVAVFGEALPLNVAVIVPRDGYTEHDVETAVKECNDSLPDYARVGRILYSHEAFTPANGLATSNGRLRRDAIASHYLSTLPTIE